MIINPGSHDPQGPWDPNEKKKYFDLRYFWVLMPFLVVMVGLPGVRRRLTALCQAASCVSRLSRPCRSGL